MVYGISVKSWNTGEIWSKYEEISYSFISTPFHKIVPLSGLQNLEISFTIVDFPVLFRPTIEILSLFSILKLISSNISFVEFGYVKETFLNSIDSKGSQIVQS